MPERVLSELLPYANEKNVTSGWHKENIETPAHPITVTVGHHTFRK
jgi:hypothetical protein